MWLHKKNFLFIDLEKTGHWQDWALGREQSLVLVSSHVTSSLLTERAGSLMSPLTDLSPNRGHSLVTLSISKKVLYTVDRVRTYKVDEESMDERERHCAFLSQSILTVQRRHFMNQTKYTWCFIGKYTEFVYLNT